MILALATLGMGLGVAEAVTASTLNAATAIGRADEIGSIEVGKCADLIVLNEPTYQHLVYNFGLNPVRHVVKGGQVVVRNGLVTPQVQRVTATGGA
jgi:imidazolonepropionase